MILWLSMPPHGLEVSTGVHWLTEVTSAPLDEVLTAIGGNVSRAEDRGGFGHPSRVVHESGAEVYFGSRREDQPICINVPGETCETWANHFLTLIPPLRGRVTRVDVAADLGPPDLARRRIVEMHRSWKRGRVETRMSHESHRMFKSMKQGDGWTAYFGATSSRLQLRAYDRRGPLRLEFQFRPQGTMGGFIAEDLLRNGPASMWRRMAREVVFPMPWYLRLMKGEVAELPAVEPEGSDFARMVDQLRLQFGTRLWLLQQLGMTIEDVATPPENPRADLWAELHRLAIQAEDLGYDSTTAKEELKRWRRRSS